MEQDNVYKQIDPKFNHPPVSGTAPPGEGSINRWLRLQGMGYNDPKNPRPKYLRCPSDDYQLNMPWTNYAGSLGPQCLAPYTNCPMPTYGWCQPEKSGLGGGVAGMGYTWSPDHGNAWGSQDVRGMFNRLGADISMSGVTDGLSNTILVGETLPEQHDHFTNAGWYHFNGAGVGAGTNVPINMRSDGNDCNDPVRRARFNWNVSWGFKSKHSGGANFLFGDGSVRFIRETIDHRTYQLLGCRNDGIAVNIP